MANPLPNALALATINDGSVIVASDHRNNYAAIQAAANLIRAALAGGVSGQFLQAVDGTDVQWATIQKYRKTTAKVVANSVVETDLLNGEITVGAGAIGPTGVLRLTAYGDWINNTGAAVATPRIKLKLGATTLIDTNVVAAAWGTSASRFRWRIDVVIMNLAAANSQWADFFLSGNLVTVGGNTNPTTGEGLLNLFSSKMEAQAANASAVDTTAAQTLALTVTLATANALEDMTLKGALVEIV